MIGFQGERISATEGIRCKKEYANRGWFDEYMLAVKLSQEWIDPSVYGNRARYANHSCDANSAFYTRRLEGTEFQVVLTYATRSIKCGEEIPVN